MEEIKAQLPTIPSPGVEVDDPTNAPYVDLDVLVADDNEVNVNVVTKMLKLENVHQFTVARVSLHNLAVMIEMLMCGVQDGQEAFDQVKRRMDKNDKFDIIFMDILVCTHIRLSLDEYLIDAAQMPRLDGLQSTEMIRKLGYSGPIVAVTASAEGPIVEQGLGVGIDCFLRFVLPSRLPLCKAKPGFPLVFSYRMAF